MILSENQFLTFKTKRKALRIHPQHLHEFFDQCFTYVVKSLDCGPKNGQKLCQNVTLKKIEELVLFKNFNEI
jgi:hypothetical protein